MLWHHDSSALFVYGLLNFFISIWVVAVAYKFYNSTHGVAICLDKGFKLYVYVQICTVIFSPFVVGVYLYHRWPVLDEAITFVIGIVLNFLYLHSVEAEIGKLPQ